MRTNIHAALIATAVVALSACGGGGGGVGSTPYVPSPTPSPSPNPTPPPFPTGAAIGLTGGPFSTYAVYGGNENELAMGPGIVQLSYSEEDNLYTISAPGIEEGHLVDTTIGSGSWMEGTSTWSSISYTGSFLTKGDSTERQSGSVYLDWAEPPYSESELSYTSFGSWYTDGMGGQFVYGIATAAGDVPVTGSASYDGEIRGWSTSDGTVYGDIGLSFDFGAATLSGEMHPWITDWSGWNPLSLGTYTFRDTVYSTGSTSFSGAFDVADSDAPSMFEGSFTGPGAVELMGDWFAPYLSPQTGEWGNMAGVFAAKKQ